MYNVPPLFNIVFTAVKVFIPRRTLEKIVVIGGSRGGNVRKLLEQVEPVADLAVVGGGGAEEDREVNGDASCLHEHL